MNALRQRVVSALFTVVVVCVGVRVAADLTAPLIGPLIVLACLVGLVSFVIRNR